MAIRCTTVGPMTSRVGVAHRTGGRVQNAKPVSTITIGAVSDSGWQAFLAFDDAASQNLLHVRLTPKSCLEIVKGLLQNLPASYIAADDELMHIIKGAWGESDEQAKAVVTALKKPVV